MFAEAEARAAAWAGEGRPGRDADSADPVPGRDPQAAVAPAVSVGGGPLVVDLGIAVSGEVAACDRLVVRGSVRGVLRGARALEVAEGGRFTAGRAEVDEAEVAGAYEGELTVRGRLLIRRTGRVTGTVRCGELVVERGGRLAGAVSQLEGKAPKAGGSGGGGG